jgi:hypothetical protein
VKGKAEEETQIKKRGDNKLLYLALRIPYIPVYDVEENHKF